MNTTSLNAKSRQNYNESIAEVNEALHMAQQHSITIHIQSCEGIHWGSTMRLHSIFTRLKDQQPLKP